MADDADLAAIRAFAAGGGQFQTDRNGNIVAPIESQPTPDATPAATPAQPAATTPGAQQSDRVATQREAERQADRNARLQRQAQADQQRRAKEAQARNPLMRFSNALRDWAANVPTPGGNLALLLILIFFAFAVIPVNSGKTRLQLIWAVLTGNAALSGTGQANAQNAPAIVSGVASGIGTGVATGLGVPGLATPAGGDIVTGTAAGVAAGLGWPGIANLLEPPRGGGS